MRDFNPSLALDRHKLADQSAAGDGGCFRVFAVERLALQVRPKVLVGVQNSSLVLGRSRPEPETFRRGPAVRAIPEREMETELA